MKKDSIESNLYWAVTFYEVVIWESSENYIP